MKRAIERRARAAGLTLDDESSRCLAAHARRVLEVNPALHLTAITEPAEFVERHIGESLEGARLLEPGASGRLVDLGSGNGYPGVVVATVRRGLEAALVESSWKKAAFLRSLTRIEGMPRLSVVERQVQRPSDLADLGSVAVFTARAVGNWERLLPRLSRSLGPGGKILLWAGNRVEPVARRAAWQRLRLRARHPLPARERSWIWLFELAT